MHQRNARHLRAQIWGATRARSEASTRGRKSRQHTGGTKINTAAVLAGVAVVLSLVPVLNTLVVRSGANA